MGANAAAFACDVGDADQVAAAFAATVDRFGAVDSCFANAGIGARRTRFGEISLEEWRDITRVNLDGAFLTLQAAVRHMVERGKGGSLVVTSSIASVSGMRGEALQAAYSSAKGGVIALSKSAAAEYAQRGVRGNVVCPGGVRTPSIEYYFQKVPGAEEASVRTHAMRRLAEPEEIADVVSFLCSDRSSFVTGHVMVADGGVLVNPHTL